MIMDPHNASMTRLARNERMRSSDDANRERAVRRDPGIVNNDVRWGGDVVNNGTCGAERKGSERERRPNARKTVKDLLAG